MDNCGYIYVAVGLQYIQEAIISATSLRKVDKNAHITLVTDQKIDNNLFNEVVIEPANFEYPNEAFAYRIRNEAFAYRIRNIYQKSPYKKTFFIDSDTYFYENCTELFKLLDYFDICMAPAPIDTHSAKIDGTDLTACTPYNCGVIAFRKNAKNNFLFKKWEKIFMEKIKNDYSLLRTEKRDGETDQTSFMESLLKSKSRVYVLPYIWNARIPYYINLKGKVKIVHGRCNDYEKLRKIINITDVERCWDPVKKRCIYENNHKIYPKIKQGYKKLSMLISKIKTNVNSSESNLS